MGRLPPARTQLCVRCGRQASNWHEKLPRGRGGVRDAFNAIPLCGSGTTGDHGWVTMNPEAAMAEGLTVSGYMVRGRYIGPNVEYQRHYNGETDD